MASKKKDDEKSLQMMDHIRRWWPRMVGVLLLLVVVVFAGEQLVVKWIDPQAMQVRLVQVEGTFQQVKASEVKQVATALSERGFLGVDVEQLKEAVEAMPWVKQASVRRLWPDTLFISLEEQTASARWGDKGLVSPNGELFFPQSTSLQMPQFKPLPMLFGPGGNGAVVLAKYRKIEKMMAGSNLQGVRLEQDERRAWKVTLSSGVKLLLGRKQSEARLARFIRLYPHVLSTWESVIDEVDLRYTNGFAVRWNGAGGSESEIVQG